MLPRRAGPALIVLAVLLVATGCVTRLDMATAYDAGRPATTFRYVSVRGARQFPDYQPIGRSILTGVDPEAAKAGASKGGKPGRGSK